jgi:hypothetical protein
LNRIRTHVVDKRRCVFGLIATWRVAGGIEESKANCDGTVGQKRGQNAVITDLVWGLMRGNLPAPGNVNKAVSALAGGEAFKCMLEETEMHDQMHQVIIPSIGL